jgi:TetR/AcrR family transcriptional regulator, regulator of autoinduction and epiphytic fitness
MSRLQLREQIARLKNDGILNVVTRLLHEKGFDAMTMDEVAEQAGMAKVSLYKIYRSKEELGSAAMVRALDRAIELAQSPAVATMPNGLPRIRALVDWAYDTQLRGEMPSLPAQNSALRDALAADKHYLDRLMHLSDLIGGWIEAAQAKGEIVATLPPDVVLFTIFARACDPVVGVLQSTGNYTPKQIRELLTQLYLQGLCAPPSPDPHFYQ